MPPEGTPHGKFVLLLAGVAGALLVAIAAGAFLFMSPPVTPHALGGVGSEVQEDLTVRFSSMGIIHDGEMRYGYSPLVSVLWDFGDGTTSNETSPTHTFPGPGTYTVTVTIAREDGQTVSDRQTVTVP